jgi:Aspartyl protease.
MEKSLVFTKIYEESEYNGYIATDEYICYENNKIPVKALWDTGSSDSVISSDLAKRLGLHSVGKAKINSSGSTYQSGLYEVVLLLDEKETINLHVMESHQLDKSGIDMLIGLDVICLGDFALSTYDGTICLSFRMPSKGLINFNDNS